MAFNILEHVALAYQPIWGGRRQLLGVRLRVQALDTGSVDAAHLLRVLEEEWSAQAPELLFSFADMALLQQALQQAPRWCWLEIPDFGDAVPPELVQAMAHARGAGARLVQSAPLGRFRAGAHSMADGFRCLFDLSSEPAQQALAGAKAGQPSPVLAGQLYQQLDSQALAHHCLDERQAWGVCGWPTEDVLRAHRSQGISVDKRTLVRLQQLLMHEPTMDQVEDLIHQDVVLTYRLLRLVNAAVFGANRQVETIRQALMLLGQKKLRDWLLEQLPSASTDLDLLPVRQAMVLRARLMEALMNPGSQHALRAEILITGLFSQLPRITHEALSVTLGRVPLSDAVQDALLRQQGPYHAYLDIARRMEDWGRLPQLAGVCEACGFPLDRANLALVRILAHWRHAL